jgi:DNA-binding GntR family transcriptional regulator
MSKIENKILTDLVYDKLKAMIDNGILQPGQKVNKVEIAEILGVSQTPINDALSRLGGEKFIEQKSRQGYFVRSFGNAELSALFEMRGAIEGMAIRLCIENASQKELDLLTSCFDGFILPFPKEKYNDYVQADKLFHEYVVRFSGNVVLEELTRTSGYMIKSNQKGLVRPPEETIPEHSAMIEAIRRKDGDRAQYLMVQHHLKSRDVFRASLLGKKS